MRSALVCGVACRGFWLVFWVLKFGAWDDEIRVLKTRILVGRLDAEIGGASGEVGLVRRFFAVGALWGRGARPISLSTPAEGPVYLVQIELFRIEVAADPFQEVLMFGVGGFPDGIEEMFVARYAADVFGRAGACSFQADRIEHPFFCRLDFFYEKDVLPVVAKVVLVRELRTLLGQKIGKRLVAP
ncbi:MAG: hypothetical protein A3G20_07890 [Acidobacteria bacterium RIFCSPLOWO2_12_FULL_59_11]|nr:MAG: hypothetical protein A3G20_07890 [Acidobacteria bacterium RIFCSPLOWO2_12_FULL_59_11]